MEEAAGDRKLPKHDLKAMTAAHAYRQGTSYMPAAMLPVSSLLVVARPMKDMPYHAVSISYSVSLTAGSSSEAAAAWLTCWTAKRITMAMTWSRLPHLLRVVSHGTYSLQVTAASLQQVSGTVMHDLVDVTISD